MRQNATKALSVSKAHDSFPGTMVKIAVREIAERAGITSARELSRVAELPYESCRLLWNGTSTMISVNTMDKLCRALGVRPAQLFEYDPSR